MRDSVSFPPLSAEKNAEIALKIKERSLDYPDLLPLIAHLAYEQPLTVLLTPVKHVPLKGEPANDAHDHEMLFHFAAGCLHDDLMKGHLPTSPVIKYPVKYPTALLNAASAHEAALRRAATMAEMFLAQQVIVYADYGVDQGMKEMLSVAKALKMDVQYKLLHAPEYWTGAPAVKNLEAALAAHDGIKPCKKFRTRLDPQQKKDIKKKLEQKTLASRDAMAAALYIHDSAHVVVESPYAPKFGKESHAAFSVMDRSINMRFAYAAQKSLLLQGHMPSASHTEFTHDGILNDAVTHERVLGIAAGLAKTLFFDESRLYDNRGVSNGMEKGVDFAVKVGRPVHRYRVSDLPVEYWRGSFEDYIEETFKPVAETMEMAMALMYPDRMEPALTILAATCMPWDSLKHAASLFGEDTLQALSGILPQELMERVSKARADGEREQNEKKISCPKALSAFDKLRRSP